MSDCIVVVDRYLGDIGALEIVIGRLSDAMSKEIGEITEKHSGKINELRERFENLEKQLEIYVKKHRVDVLDGNDRVDLPHGSVLLKEEKRVKRIRKMLENLKAAGLTDAVKSEEVVDWDKVDGFDDKTLKTLGTKRVPKDVFSYEIKKMGDYE